MSLFEQYVKTNRKLPPELLQTLSGIDEPARLADTIAAHISVRLADKQRLLETLAVGERLECWSAWSTARSTCRWKSASAAASSRRWRRASASTTSTSR
jgi:ATP-dependent Lon protease